MTKWGKAAGNATKQVALPEPKDHGKTKQSAKGRSMNMNPVCFNKDTSN